MKLYYSKGGCSLAVRIVIHEIGLSCEFESVDLKAKRTSQNADFLKINPKGAIPVLVVDSNEVLTENSVIQQYLADTTNSVGLLPPVGDFKRYRVLEWLNFVSTDLHKGCSPLFNPQIPQDLKDTLFIPLLKGKLNFVEKSLQAHQFLLGNQFTLADGYLFVVLSWLTHFKIEMSEWPNIVRYVEDLKKRPSVHQALQEEGLA